MADVTMPQLGETVTEGTITRWFKQVGEEVARDEPLFEVSTDKVDSEVPSPASGTLTELLVPEGETVEVGARLAVIGDAGEAPSTDGSGTASGRAAAPAAEASPQPAEAAPAAEAAESVPGSEPPPAVEQPPAAAERPTAVVEQPPAAAAPPPPPPAVAAPPPPAPAPPPAGQQPAAQRPGGQPPGGQEAAELLVSPMVRRLMREEGLDPSEVTGTGPGGRITRDDVLAVIDTRRRTPNGKSAAPSRAPAAAGPPAAGPAAGTAPSAPAAPAPGSPLGDRVVPFSNIRRRTAEHMVRSKATAPHAFIATEVDFENVERARAEAGPRLRAEEGLSLTYLPFIARATVEALREHPELNASVEGESLVVHQAINLGIAVDLAHQGLIVPVIHQADEITLLGMARRIKDLAERARTRQLGADDIVGGTFSISNDGPFGTMFTMPIINQPQVAVLASDGVKRRPVVVQTELGEEAIAIHSVGLLGVSFDHRAVDGAYVAAFLRRVSELLSGHHWQAEL